MEKFSIKTVPANGFPGKNTAAQGQIPPVEEERPLEHLCRTALPQKTFQKPLASLLSYLKSISPRINQVEQDMRIQLSENQEKPSKSFEIEDEKYQKLRGYNLLVQSLINILARELNFIRLKAKIETGEVSHRHLLEHGDPQRGFMNPHFKNRLHDIKTNYSFSNGKLVRDIILRISFYLKSEDLKEGQNFDIHRVDTLLEKLLDLDISEKLGFIANLASGVREEE